MYEGFDSLKKPSVVGEKIDQICPFKRGNVDEEIAISNPISNFMKLKE